MSSTPASERVLPFESASELREAHARLLEALDTRLEEDSSAEAEAAALADLETQIRQFLERGAATGIYLEEVKQRTACQVLMDYWASTLSQTGMQVAAGRLARFDGEQLPDLNDRACPYVGLEAFRDRAFFFGREADTQALLAQLRDTELVVVLGASGSGKSSLVMGGVLPELEAETREPALRILPPFVPGNAVLASLAHAVLHGHSSGDLAADVAALREDPEHLAAMVDGGEARPTLVTIDQFEEVFTLSAPADRDALAANLAQLLKAGRGHRVILTMREEFRSRVVELRALSPYLNAAWYSMRPMGYEELKAAIEGPAALVNLQFQSGIVDDLVKKVLGQPAALPLLQFALRSLWEARDRNRITWEVYRAVGDPLTALQSAADAFYDGLATQTQDEVHRILLDLVRVDDLLEAYRQPVRKNRLLEAGKANTVEALELLAAHEFVRIAHGPNESDAIVEIRHESLIRNWPRFVGWIDDKRRDRRQRFVLTQAADQWSKGGRPREGLLTGWQLQQAAEQSDLSILEQDFIQASAGAIQRRQRRKERAFLASFGFVLVLIAFVWAVDHFYLAERRRTWGELDFLQNMGDDDQSAYAEMGLDNVAIHLWEQRRANPKSLDTLVQILKDADRRGLFRHDIYKVTKWTASEDSTSSMSSVQDKGTIVTLEYPKNAMLSAPLLVFYWHNYSTSMDSDEIPIPAKVTVAARTDDSSLYRVTVKRWPRQQTEKPGELNTVSAEGQVDKVPSRGISTARVKGPRKAAGGDPQPALKFLEKPEGRNLDFTLQPSDVLLNDFDLDRDARALFEKYKAEWPARALSTEATLKHWWWVPRWTIPIWKAARARQLYPPEVGAILYAREKIRQEPDFLDSDGFVAAALHWQAIQKPATVRAACESSGGIVPLLDNTKSWIAGRKPFSQLENLLEDLARKNERPTITPADQCSVDELWNSVSKQFETASLAQELETTMRGAYRPPLQVYIAPNLKAYIATPSGTLDSAVLSRIDQQLRAEIQQAVGFRVPAVQFASTSDFANNQFTIELRGRSLAPRLLASSGSEVDDIMEGLKQHLLLTRELWLDTEEAARLTNDLPPAPKEWLSKNYSDGQMGMILQRAVSNDANRDPRPEADAAAEQHRAGATLTYFSWLVRSLAFWKQICGGVDNIQCLGDGLRRTQQARLSQLGESPRSMQPAAPYPGVAALIAGRLDESSMEFAQRIRASNIALESSAFVAAYSRMALQVEFAEIQKDCNPSNYAGNESRFGANFARTRISALLTDYGKALSGSMRAQLELCQIDGLLSQASEHRQVRDMIDRQFSSVTTQWTSDEKWWLSYLALRDHLDSAEAKDKAPPQRLNEIRSLLSEAIQDLPTDAAETVYDKISDLCNKPSAGYWCMQIFKDWPNLKSDSYWIPLELANAIDQQGRDEAHAALQYVDRAELNLSAVDKNRRRLQRAWMTYIRGSAHEALAELGVDGELDTAIAYLTGLMPIFDALQQDALPDWSGLIENSTFTLAAALLVKGDFDGASKVISRGKKHIKKPSDALVFEQVSVLWAQGKFTEAGILAGDISAEGRRLFFKCTSKIYAEEPAAAKGLEEDVDQLLKTSHGYRDYIRLQYFWYLMRTGDKDKAVNFLQSRWHEINPSDLAEPPSWKPRLTPERGDYSAVWQEMLVGYFLGKVSQQQVTADWLDSSRNFESSPFARSAESRQGYLTEWYFYDALLQSVTGDRSSRLERFRSSLEKAVNLKQPFLYEHSFAKSLLSRSEPGDDPTRQAHSK